MNETGKIDFTERVLRGAARLDEWRHDWPSMVDIPRLDVVDPWLCVVSQTAGRYAEDDSRRSVVTHGSYANGLNVLGIEPEVSHHYGFIIPTWEYELAEFVVREDSGRTGASITGAYAHLTDTWREVISARLSAVQASA